MNVERVARQQADELRRRHPRPEPEPTGPFTTRELEVLQLIADGYRIRDIGRMVHMSPHTVRSHLKNMARKARIKRTNRQAALVAYALRRGLIT